MTEAFPRILFVSLQFQLARSLEDASHPRNQSVSWKPFDFQETDPFLREKKRRFPRIEREDGEAVQPGYVMGTDVEEDEKALVVRGVSTVGSQQTVHWFHGD